MAPQMRESLPIQAQMAGNYSNDGTYCKTIGNKPLWRVVILAVFAALTGFAQPAHTSDLSQASLEDLMNMQVTTVSKKEQKLSQTGAAIFVITQEDIRRSGATNIPDLLRLAPGVDVAQVDGNRWAISIRGFSDQHANKVLVLVDGRSVYSPSFSGVFWDMVDVPLEDIDRIEVIRGPGGTVWGSNAVNGVINIITKKADATQGGLISAGGGSHDHADTLAQYGGQIGQSGSYRIFGRFFNVGNAVFAGGQPAADGWAAGHAGFRSDWNLSPRDTLTVQGDFLKTDESQTLTSLFANALPLLYTFNDPIAATAANVLERWNHTLANGSQMSLQVYDDYSRHREQGFLDQQNTVDVDFEHHIALGSRNDVVWGLGARVISSQYGTGYTITILPNRRLDHLFSGFVQDEVKLANSLALTIGSKFEHNSFTGFEFEPSVQLVWTLSPKQALWASGDRALREPSALDAGLDDYTGVPVGPTVLVIQTLGNPHMKAEELRDFEGGYRAQVAKRLSLDVDAFTNLYRNLEAVAPGAPYFLSQGENSYMVFPQAFVNSGRAHTYGLEFSGSWNVTNHWRISPGYSYFHMNLDGDPSTINTTPGVSPAHQFQIRSQLDLPHRLEWDNTLEYVSKLSTGNIPAYARLDSRLGWRIGESVELSVVAQNLLSPRHPEFADGNYPLLHTLVERGVFGKLTFRF
jgi:iron complex outermembrane receptor protein